MGPFNWNCFVVDLDYQYFWRWTSFIDYCYFVVLFSVVGSVVTFLFVGFSVYVEMLGFASLLLEACLGMPQLWRNYNNMSTEGMRWAILSFYVLFPLKRGIFLTSAVFRWSSSG